MIVESEFVVHSECVIFPRKGAEVDKWARVVVFKDGHRIEKKVHVDHLAKGVAAVKAAREKGYKAHLVYRTADSVFPPPKQIAAKRDEGYLWCPYCRAWRFFSVPKYKALASVVDSNGNLILQGYLNAMANQDMKVCQWCTISENEWYVRKANGTWGESTRRRRPRRRRVRR